MDIWVLFLFFIFICIFVFIHKHGDLDFESLWKLCQMIIRYYIQTINSTQFDIYHLASIITFPQNLLYIKQGKKILKS